MKRSGWFILFLFLLTAACSPSVKVNQPAGALSASQKESTPALPAPAATQKESIPALPAPTATEIPVRIRAAFYYPWFPEAWKQQGYNPFTNYSPSLGYYDSGQVAVIQDHIRAMTYGNIDAAILSWWGQGSMTDQRVAAILAATPGSSNPNFRWGIYYENESVGDPPVSQIQSDLAYIRDHYSQNSNFLKLNGKFVVFVYADGNDSCGMVDRWVQANRGLGSPAYIDLKVFSGYRTCSSQPDSWHQYAPSSPTKDQKGYSFTISPGFWKKGEPSARLARDLSVWESSIKAMVASGATWQLVTTFNEWGEGTAVESAQEWASPSGYGSFLDVLHNYASNPPPG